jgi:hypothetical protein
MSKTTLATTGAKEAFKNAISIGQKYAAELAESEEFFKPIVMAMAIQELKQALTPEAIAAVHELEGTALGFKTDKFDGKYGDETIRMCVIEAMLRGVSIVGNQFNVIKGNFYIARNGWEAKLRKAGCTQIVPTIGKPEDVLLGTPNDKGNRQITATFAAQATCVKDGKRYPASAVAADGIDGRIEVSAFGKDLQACIDGLKGKAEARILKKLFFLACDATELDDDEATVIVVEPSPAERIEQAPVVQEPPMPSTQRAAKFPREGENAGRGDQDRLPRRFDHGAERLAAEDAGAFSKDVSAGEVQRDQCGDRRHGLGPRRVSPEAGRAGSQAGPHVCRVCGE